MHISNRVSTRQNGKIAKKPNCVPVVYIRPRDRLSHSPLGQPAYQYRASALYNSHNLRFHNFRARVARDRLIDTATANEPPFTAVLSIRRAARGSGFSREQGGTRRCAEVCFMAD